MAVRGLCSSQRVPPCAKRGLSLHTCLLPPGCAFCSWRSLPAPHRLPCRARPRSAPPLSILASRQFFQRILYPHLELLSTLHTPSSPQPDLAAQPSTLANPASNPLACPKAVMTARQNGAALCWIRSSPAPISGNSLLERAHRIDSAEVVDAAYQAVRIQLLPLLRSHCRRSTR